MTMYKKVRENGLIEIICEHGVGHPSRLLTPLKFYYDVHGCDGCCGSDEFKAKELELSAAGRTS